MGNGFPVSGVVATPSVNDLHEKKAPPHYNTVSTQSQSTHNAIPLVHACIDIYLRIHTSQFY